MPAVRQDDVTKRLKAVEDKLGRIVDALAGLEPHRNRSMRETLAKVQAAVTEDATVEDDEPGDE